MPDASPAYRSVSAVQVSPCGAVRGSLRPPGSKSLTNRALICAAFADGASILRGALRSEDTEVMIAALGSIGVAIKVGDAGRTLSIQGLAPQRRDFNPTRAASPDRRSPTEMYIANSGTTIRFLTAALSAFGGHYRLHGTARMHERPIGDLVDSISPILNGTIVTETDGCPPLRMDSRGWQGDAIEVAGNVSSQYLSGLMMAAPITGRPLQLRVTGELVSKPYVEMTAHVMTAFSAELRRPGTSRGNSPDLQLDELAGDLEIELSGSSYAATDYAIEPDASAASYFWAAAAITGGTVTVEGLNRQAIQGDVGFVDVLEQMGCQVSASENGVTVSGGQLRGVDVNMNSISDTVQTLAVVSLFASGPTRVRGVAHNRYKETDRIGCLACELRKLGATVDEHEDGLTITPPASHGNFMGATIETYDDHRMAMSLALAGLRLPGVKIMNPACTGKTYPDFFADLESLSGLSHRWITYG